MSSHYTVNVHTMSSDISCMCERESVCPLVMCRCVRRRRPLCLSPRRVGGSAAGGGGARVAAGYVSAPGAHRSSGTSLTRSYNAGERAHRTTSGRRARGSTTNARAGAGAINQPARAARQRQRPRASADGADRRARICPQSGRSTDRRRRAAAARALCGVEGCSL